jgi:hypothetical protein
MLRRLVRTGLRAVQAGEEPHCVRGAPGKTISTYCHDSVVRVPERAGADDDTRLGDIGRTMARIVVDEDNGIGRDRTVRVAQKIAALSEPPIASAAE